MNILYDYVFMDFPLYRFWELQMTCIPTCIHRFSCVHRFWVACKHVLNQPPSWKWKFSETRQVIDKALVPSVLLIIRVWDMFVRCHSVQRLFHLSSVPFGWQSSCCNFVVRANRYDTISSIWLSGPADNLEGALQEPHHRETDGLYSCLLP